MASPSRSELQVAVQPALQSQICVEARKTRQRPPATFNISKTREMASFSRFPALLLLLLRLAIWTGFPARVDAELSLLPGYVPIELTADVESALLQLVSKPEAYTRTVSKRICILSVDGVSRAAYTSVQLNFHVTGCDVRKGLEALDLLATKTAINEELANLGMCSTRMEGVCRANHIEASIEIVEKIPSMISYIRYDSL